MKAIIRTYTNKVTITLFASLLLFPQMTHAQSGDGLQEYIADIADFINGVLIPTIFAIALLVFLFNVARYFIIESQNEEARAKAKQIALYAIAGFVFLASIWGIINVLVDGIRIGGDAPITPDYIERNVL